MCHLSTNRIELYEHVPPVVDAPDSDGHAEPLEGGGLGPGQQSVHSLNLLHGEREGAEQPEQQQGKERGGVLTLISTSVHGRCSLNLLHGAHCNYFGPMTPRQEVCRQISGFLRDL